MTGGFASQSASNAEHQSSTLLPLRMGIDQWLVDSLHKGPVMWKAFTSHHIIMILIETRIENVTSKFLKHFILIILMNYLWNHFNWLRKSYRCVFYHFSALRFQWSLKCIVLKLGTYLLEKVNAFVTDDLVMQGVRASAAMVHVYWPSSPGVFQTQHKKK